VAEHPINARLYDRLLASTERGGLREMRAKLLREAHGRTLEIGTGTGLNLPHYTDAVTELVLCEPSPPMVRQLRRKLEQNPPSVERVEVVEAPAEHLPFDDGSFDTVVSALVLCTVDDPRAAIAEARRVLAEKGALLFLEHVRGSGRRLAFWQDLFERPWGFIAGGCHPNRPTEDLLAGAGFWIERLDRGKVPKAPPIVRPLISGVARRPGPADSQG
jgi:SAM-dependent methyltransferase